MKNRKIAAVRPKVLNCTQASVDMVRQITSLRKARAKKKAVTRRVSFIQPSSRSGMTSSITNCR